MKNILLVDDDNIFRFANRKLLEVAADTPYICSASNGMEALRFIEHEFRSFHTLPEVIFLDLHMPVMDGVQFIEAFEKMTLPHINEVKIVLISSSASEAAVVKEQHPAIHSWLLKPLNVAVLRETFEAMSHPASW